LLDEKERDKRAKAFVKKFAWKGPWFVLSAMKSEGTSELTFAIMDYLEGARRGKPARKR
jgi:GTPase